MAEVLLEVESLRESGGWVVHRCQKHHALPWGIYEKHVPELQDIVFDQGECRDVLKAAQPASRARSSR